MRVADILWDIRNAVEGLLEIPPSVKLKRLSHQALPVRSGWKFVRAHIEDGRVVQGPLHGIPGMRHYAQHRRLPSRGDGRLTTGERQAAGLVRRQHCPFKDR